MIEINFKEVLKKLRPVTWVYKDDQFGRKNIGYIAEELFETDDLRYVVSLDEAGIPDGIDYAVLSVYAIEGIKTAYKEIEMLNNRISFLESKLAE
jgi:hypothetical protein